MSIKISWTALDNYLHGRTQLGQKSLKKLAEFLRVPVSEVPPRLEPFGRRPAMKIAEESPPYRTRPNLKAGVLFRKQPTSVLIDELAGLLKDEGVTVEDRIVNADSLFDEIKRRLRSLVEN